MDVGCGEWSRKGKSCSLRLLGLASHCGNLPSMPVLGIGEAPPFGSHFANLPLMQRVVLIALYREHSALAELNFLVSGIALIWRSRPDKTQAISVRVEETKAMSLTRQVAEGEREVQAHQYTQDTGTQ
jgi:hypothetical protein